MINTWVAGEEMTEESDMFVQASDLIRIVEASILTFQMFVKMDKTKKLKMNQNQMATPLQQVQSSLEKVKKTNMNMNMKLFEVGYV